MTQRFEELTTRTGRKVLVRAADPRDEEALDDFFHHVSPDDLRFRFLGTVKDVTQERLVEMLAVDHRRSETYLAFERMAAPLSPSRCSPATGPWKRARWRSPCAAIAGASASAGR